MQRPEFHPCAARTNAVRENREEDVEEMKFPTAYVQGKTIERHHHRFWY